MNWSEVYSVYSGTATTSVVSGTDIDLQAVYSSHVLEMAVTASGGGNQIVQWRGSLDGSNWYDVGANPIQSNGVSTTFYMSNVPARHIRADISAASGTNTVTITGASKE